MVEDWKKKQVFWHGPVAQCDVCHLPVKEYFVDGRTRVGPWAIMCHVLPSNRRLSADESCFERLGVGLGLGHGQLYQRQPDGRFMKIQG